MKITSVTAYAVKIPRDPLNAMGTAGTPARLLRANSRDAPARSHYLWAENYRTLYSTGIETTLVKIETDAAITGWGEAQSPVAPEITATVINSLLASVITGDDALAPEQVWSKMYAAMRVRGHTGGFLLDAIAGIDIALWDLCGKAYAQPICRLLGVSSEKPLPCYVSGLAGANVDEKLVYARTHVDAGAKAFKLFLDGTEAECLRLIDGLREAFEMTVDLYVDALWRLTPNSAVSFAHELARRKVGWLEAPLMPEDVAGHARLTAHAEVPIAIGESYRTRFEMLPFFKANALDILQPDIGRSGITEGRKLAVLADTFHVKLAPHISIGLGVQIAAALHFGAACDNSMVMECNPQVYEVANKFLKNPIEYGSAALVVPEAPGLGIEINEAKLEQFIA
jgi:galactonate dehydratase